MIKRMMVALGGALAFVGMLPAQVPTALAIGQAPMVAEAPAPAPGAACCPDGNGCADPGPRLQISADYLFAWIFGNRLDPLVTTSPPGTARALAGIPSLGATHLASGRVNDDPRPGFRLTADYWLDPQQAWGLSAGFLMTSSEARIFSFTSSGLPILARPFQDAATGTPLAVLIAFPGSSGGSIDIRLRSGNFYQGNIDILEKCYDEDNCRLDGLLGYRYYRYDEGLQFRQVINPTDPNFVPGTELRTIDHFVTNNYFNGAEVGLRGQYTLGNLEFRGLAKFALGNLHREVKITGSQVTLIPGLNPVVQQGGVYALQSNIGLQKYDEWAAQPELGVNVAYRIGSHLKVHFGYTAMMLSNISRAYSQVQFFINPALFPGSTQALAAPIQPTATKARDDIWLQFINVGADFTW